MGSAFPKKTETCCNCKKKIDLIESAYHEHMCEDCYWDQEFSEFERFITD